MIVVEKGIDSPQVRRKEEDDLSKSKQRGNVKDQALIRKKAIEDQDILVGKLDNLHNMHEKGLGSRDGCQIWTIVISAVILIILVALIIWV